MSRPFAHAQHFQHLVSSASWLQRVTRLETGSHRTLAAYATSEAQKRPRPHIRKQAAPATTLSQTSALLLEAAKKKGAPLVVLQKGKARLFWEGAPMVYGGAVERVDADKPPATGNLVVLTDANLVPLGWGVYNSESMYRLRVLQWCEESSGETSTLLELGPLLEERVLAAVSLRAALGLPSTATTVYRLINSEGDRLSGLTVDVYGSVLVAAYSAAWVELNRPAVEAALREATGLSHILWRPQRELLKLEGLLMDEPEGNKDETTPPCENEQASQPSHVRVQENGVSFKVNLRHGQKTGFYTDQRDSRALIRSLSPGKSLLDLCCYTGGFALNAAAGGAAKVTDPACHAYVGVDSSLAAVSLAKENASLSSETVHATFVAGAVESFMQDAASSGQRWDIVILDPPKLAPKRRDLLRATPKYRKLNVAALRLVKPGGLLMTCSCSGAVAQGTGLLPIVKEAAQIAGRRVSLLRHAGAAMDHPLDPGYPEGQYLTNLLLRVA